jgi:hypothetical protein
MFFKEWKARIGWRIIRPMISLALVLVAAVESASTASALDPPINGAELNLACAPPAGDPPNALSANHCASTALFALMEFSRLDDGSNESGGDTMFCLPRSVLASVENVAPLIDAYRRQYGREPSAFAAMSPLAAFVRAMRREWPCAGGR